MRSAPVEAAKEDCFARVRFGGNGLIPGEILCLGALTTLPSLSTESGVPPCTLAEFNLQENVDNCSSHPSPRVSRLEGTWRRADAFHPPPPSQTTQVSSTATMSRWRSQTLRTARWRTGERKFRCSDKMKLNSHSGPSPYDLLSSCSSEQQLKDGKGAVVACKTDCAVHPENEEVRRGQRELCFSFPRRAELTLRLLPSIVAVAHTQRPTSVPRAAFRTTLGGRGGASPARFRGKTSHD